jgi:hypothetical protein
MAARKKGEREREIGREVRREEGMTLRTHSFQLGPIS